MQIKMLGLVMATIISTNAFGIEYKWATYDPAWDYSVKQKEKCSHGAMDEMNFCILNEYKKADKHLNWVYNKLLNALKYPVPLKNAQRAWIKFRDLQCEFTVPSSWEGTEIPYTRNACLIDLTEKRILDLQQVEGCNGCVEFKLTP